MSKSLLPQSVIKLEIREGEYQSAVLVKLWRGWRGKDNAINPNLAKIEHRCSKNLNPRTGFKPPAVSFKMVLWAMKALQDGN